MKKTQLLKKFLLIPFVGILAYIGICSYSEGPAFFGSVDGTGATNPGGCSCHGTAAATTTVVLELDSAGIPVTSYVAGGSYTIKITGTNTGTTSLPRFGFQIAAVNVTGAGTTSATDAGALASTGLPASCQYTAPGTGSSTLPITVVEQNAAIVATSGTGGAGTTYVESIGWTAPAAGTGSIKLYGAVNAVNFDGSDLGGFDKWNYTNVTITEYTPAALAPITGTFTVCTGSTTPLSSTYTTGTWSSGSPAIATVNTSGVVTGITPGSSVIAYNEGTAGTATVTVTVSAPPSGGTIVGIDSVCAGSTRALTDPTGTGGGVWSSSAPGVATVSTSGVVTGINAGTANISYTATNSCGTGSAGVVFTVTPGSSAGTIIGAGNICSTTPVTFVDFTPGGSWSSANPAVATVSSGGAVTGITAGVDTILYSVTGSCGTVSAKKAITVSTPGAGTISGSSSICTGSASGLSDATTGGVWSSSNNSIATVSASGSVYGVAAGTDTIIYTVANSCGTYSVSDAVTVSASSAVGPISGASGVCVGSSTLLTDATGGGAWSSSNGHATVTGGLVAGVSPGVDTISYAASGGCGTGSATHIITVSSAVSAGVVSGPAAVCQGDSIMLTDTTSGGVWSSGNTAIATVSDSGVVTGISGGATVIFYTVTNGCGTASAFASIAVNALPQVGVITGASNLCAGIADTLTDTASGGSWSSSNTTATVDSAGIVTTLSGAGGLDTIRYSASNSCGTAAAQFVLTVTTSVAGTISGDNSICLGTPAILTDTTSGGTWSVSNGAAEISGAGISAVLAAVSSGFDTVYYSFTTGCGTASSSFVVNVDGAPCWPSSVNSVAASVTAFSVYPNPSAGIFTIAAPQNGGSELLVTVIDLTGKVMVTRTIANTQTAELDLSDLPPGNYLLKAEAGGNTYRGKIAIIK